MTKRKISKARQQARKTLLLQHTIEEASELIQEIACIMQYGKRYSPELLRHKLDKAFCDVETCAEVAAEYGLCSTIPQRGQIRAEYRDCLAKALEL